MKAFVPTKIARLHQARFSSMRALNNTPAYAIHRHAAIPSKLLWETMRCLQCHFELVMTFQTRQMGQEEHSKWIGKVTGPVPRQLCSSHVSTEYNPVIPVYISQEPESFYSQLATFGWILQREHTELKWRKPWNEHPLSHSGEGIYVLQHLGWLGSIGGEPEPESLDKVNKSTACHIAKEKRRNCFLNEKSSV